MAFDFPLNPVLNQEYAGYFFNGFGWVLRPTGGSGGGGSADYVEIIGDTMSGDLQISKVSPSVLLDKTEIAEIASVTGTQDGVARWAIVPGDLNENFAIYRYDASGAFLDSSIHIDRMSGAITFAGLVYGFALELNTPVAGTLESFKVAGTPVGSIYSDGFSTTYNTTSDGRLKTDLRSFEAGDIIDKLQVHDFAWKDTGERCHGVVAQEAIEVYPWAVTHTPNDWWGVDYSKYVPLLLQEVKALRERVRQLESKS